MRKITEIIIHCTATPQGREVSREEVRRWHLQRGFNDIGYHYLIHLDGRVEKGRSDAVIGAHCEGHNAASIGVCYVGGCDAAMKPKDTRTAAQKAALVKTIKELKVKFPAAKVFGHRDFAKKACPSFDATKEYKLISN
jgi:N-acetylmuramoyl-L-alanine amidase